MSSVFWQPCQLLQVSAYPTFVQGHEKTKEKQLAGQFESDKVVEDESVNESLSISQTKAQHLERNPPLAGKCSIGSNKLPFSAAHPT